ncbi:protein phosphatase 2C domain-containing protein [Streptomyces sp. NPDC003035]|uniref:protein phosphatase 2C domain-containing protein n=1 Tax=Streptomyces sp. NPDC003035 TaxID=3364676 RepID=UPI0036C16BE2
MTQQGDNWWDKLYDDTAPDTAPTATGDTLDDRFDSASRATGGTAYPTAGPPRAPWEPLDDTASGPRSFPAPPPRPPAPASDALPPGPPTASPPAQPPPPPPPPPPPKGAAPLPSAPPQPPPPVRGPLPSVAAAPSPIPLHPAGTPRPEAEAEPAPPGVPPAGTVGPDRPAAPARPEAGARQSPAGAAPPPPPPPSTTASAAPESAPAPEAAPAPGGAPAPGAVPAPGGAPAPVPEVAPAAPEAVRAPGAAPPPGAAPAPGVPPTPARPEAEAAPEAGPSAVPRPRAEHIGSRPPTYEPEPTALPGARPDELVDLVADTVLDGARYGTYTLRAASLRGDSARYRGDPRRDALLTARFGHDEAALVLVAVATGARAAESAHLAAADACRWIGEAVGRSHARLSEDIRAGRRGDLKSGLHRLTDRTFGRLRARAAERGVEPEEYTASLRCLLLSADPHCRTRVFFGIGRGGLFRLRDGAWQDIEPLVPEPAALTGAPVVGFGSPPPPSEQTEEGDRLTMDLGITTAPGPFVEPPPPPPTEPFRFRASVARPGDTLLLASEGLAEPMRGEPALPKELAGRWAGAEPPGLAAFLADVQLRVKGYADDRTGVAVWEA